MNNTVYTKETKLNLIVQGMTLTGIPVLQSVKVSFYQKYIILLLQKGVPADDIEGLISTLSSIVNVSSVCVKEFVSYLQENNFLVFHQRKKVFNLTSSVHFVVMPQYSNAMFAELSEKKADCDKLVYIQEAGKFYLESDFKETLYRKKGISQNTPIFNPLNMRSALVNNDATVKELIKTAFANTNVHVKDEITYELNDESIKGFQFEFPVLMQYCYSPETKKSTRQKTIVQEDSLIPDEIIEALSKQYDEDTKLPRFIEYREGFYEKVQPSNDEVDAIENKIIVAGNELLPLKENVQALKVQQAQVKKNYKKDIKSAENNQILITGEIEKVQSDIEMNEALVTSSQGSNDALVENLKDTIRALTKKKDDLIVRVRESQRVIEELESQYVSKDRELNEKITEQEQTIAKTTARVKKYQDRQAQLKEEYDKLLASHKKGINETVISVTEKYNKDSNIFNRYVSDICIALDCAVSASECEAYDEVAESIDSIREKYRKVMQVVFETILSKKMQTLGSFFGDKYNVIALETACKSRRISADMIAKIISYHGLANAIGHLTENSAKTADNKKRIDDFKNLSKKEREYILLAIPAFFDKIEFSKNEVKTMVNSLKM